VNLTGTGGIGKTRLGLQIATDLLENFADGVCFVPLAPIREPDLVVPTIAQVFGLKETRDQTLFELLPVYLREKHLLLLLDNFEQVVSAAPQLAELLAVCPLLKILVTSRASLHLHGEHEFPVPPLAVPDLARLPECESLELYAAVALFLERAQAIKPDFQLTKANARAIAEICARLDGLPLAIELAAARLKLLPPQALLARLEHRLRVLTSGAQNLPVRQQTLRNTIAWSYDLLDTPEQRLFRQLSIFVGGCTLEATEAVCTIPGEAAGQVVNGVATLIDKSIVQQTEQEGEPRLLMLETIREFGLELLVEQQEMEPARAAHAVYYLRLAEEADAWLWGPQLLAWLKRLEREHDNLRAALSWSLEPVSGVEAGYRKEVALRLGGALHRFWLSHAHFSEGLTFLERALAASIGAATARRAKALVVAADLASGVDNQRAEALAEEALVLYREVGDIMGTARSLGQLGRFARHRYDYARARSFGRRVSGGLRSPCARPSAGLCRLLIALIMNTLWPPHALSLAKSLLSLPGPRGAA